MNDVPRPRSADPFVRLARAQTRRPWPFLLATLALAALGGALASRLTLRTGFEELLPAAEPSVVELRRLRERLAQGSNVYVVLEGGGEATLRRAAGQVAARLREAAPAWLVEASTGFHAARDFLLPRAGLFAEPAALVALRDDLRAAVVGAAGLDLGLEEPRPLPPAGALLERLLPERARAALGARWPDGWFQDADGRALVVLVRTSIGPGHLEEARAALALVRRLSGAALAEPGLGGVRATFAGDLVTGLAEYGAVLRDLVSVGATGVGLVLAVILLYFMRMRALAVLGVAIGAGLALTFGAARLAVGHLNVATGFLVSVVAGNGINGGIIYLARWFEARRAGASAAAAVEVASAGTWLPTLGAAAAASAAYASLGVTKFLGLRHFAAIGGFGMLLCWAATFLVTPPLLVLFERRRPLPLGAGGARGAVRRLGHRYGGPLVAAVARAPLAVALSSALLVAGGAGLAMRWLRSDPLEYDMRRISNDVGGAADARRASATARRVLGANLESSMVVLADRLDQVPLLAAALEARRRAAPPDRPPFEAVHTLLDFVPAEQEAKLPVLEELGRRLRTLRRRGAVSDADWERLAPFLPPADLRPFGLGDLPGDLARRFSERDGTRGRVLFVEPASGESEDDLRYLMRFADAFRETTLPSGETVHGSGRAVLFADMLRSIVGDMPRALGLSFLFTVLAVVATFRRGRPIALVLGALLTGVTWLLALLHLGALKLNFINFVALPVTFGIGVDYAMNVVQRHASDGGVRGAVRGTGGAVVLCSLTTILSYLALLGSINQAVRSLGAVAVLGEACCLVAAVVTLPSVLLWWERRGAGRAPQEGA